MLIYRIWAILLTIIVGCGIQAQAQVTIAGKITDEGD